MLVLIVMFVALTDSIGALPLLIALLDILPTKPKTESPKTAGPSVWGGFH